MAYNRTMDENFSKFLKKGDYDDIILYAIDYTNGWNCFKSVEKLTLEVVENSPSGFRVKDANNRIETVHNIINGDAKPGDKITGLGGMSPYYLYLSKGYYIDDKNKPLSVISNMENIPAEIIQEEYNVVPNISRLFIKIIEKEEDETIKIVEKPNLNNKLLMDFSESQNTRSTINKKNPNLESIDPIKVSSNVYVVVLDKNYKPIRLLKPYKTIPLRKDLRNDYLTKEVVDGFIREAKEDYGGYTIAFSVANWSRKVFVDTPNSKITGDPYKKIYRIVDPTTFKPIDPNLVLFKEKDCVPWMDLKEGKLFYE